MVKKIVLGILLGIIATLFFAQQDPYIQHLVAQAYADGFEQTYDCRMTYRLKNLSLLRARLELEDVTIIPNKPEGWSLKAGSYSTGFSWLNIIAFGAIDLDISADKLHAQTTFTNGDFGINAFFNKIITGPSMAIPLDFKGLICSNSHIDIIDAHYDSQVSLDTDIQCHVIDDHFVTHAQFARGIITHNKKTIGTQMQGDFTFDVGPTVTVTTKGTLDLAYLDDPTCTFSCNWSDNHGVGLLSNNSGSCSCSPITITPIDRNYILNYSGKLPLSIIKPLLPDCADISGNAKVRGLVNINDISQGLAGTVTVQQLKYKNIPLLDECTVSYAYSNEHIKGGLLLEHAHVGECKGSFSYHPISQSGHAWLTNQSIIPIPALSDWRIMPTDTQLAIRLCEQDVDITCNTTAQTVYDSLKSVTASTQCSYSLATNVGSLETIMGDYTLKADVTNDHCAFTSQSMHNPLCDGVINWNGNGEMHLHMPLVRQLLDHWGYHIVATGTLDAQFLYNNSLLDLKAQLNKSTVTAAQWFNPLTSCELHATIDTQEQKITAHRIACGFSKGSIEVENGLMWYDDSYLPTFVHAGITAHGMLVNLKRDLFATVSSYMTLTKKEGEPFNVQGTLFVERSQLKENLFSQEFQKTLFQSTGQLIINNAPRLNADIVIESKDPVRVKTSLLEADAHLRLQVHHHDGISKINGLVQLTSGTIYFPYKPLHIARGTLRFLPEQSFDPLIELIARNKIKKHHVSLLVTGSATNHQVLLESSPALTEEQIIGLLLVGMPEESLSVVMPAIIANNIKNIIFSSEQSKFGVNKYASQLGELLKHVHLVPRFADQTGRGGLRGAIEIDATDRLRALIQKNFSLSEDTRFEVEYAITDDITLRGLRDERRDIAAEMEMRWKF